MRIHHAVSLALAAGTLLTAPLAFAKHTDPSNEVAPQVVHIGYLDGDVRVSRGTEGGAPKNVDWEKAVPGLPLETGFSLATGDGRAEIEFEDASTIYLAPNSVLIFNALVAVGEVPHTELALLTGTATLEVRPTSPGEVFLLRTPTDSLFMPYGKKINLRVTSYLDAVAVTPLDGGFIKASTSTPLLAPAARTLYYNSGKHIDYSAPAIDFKNWDQWVAARVSQRDAATATLLKQTGLKKPVPGLALLAGQGRFVDCPGYGSCWEPPSAQADIRVSTVTQTAGAPPSLLPANSAVGSDAHPIVVSATDSTRPSVAFSGSLQQNSPLLLNYAGFGMFPCGPGSAYFRYSMLSSMGYGMGYMDPYNSLSGSYWYASDPWAWTVCHSGSWLYQDNRYLWVPGNTIQRRMPIRWLQRGGSVGYVPIHPRDVEGKLPINRDHGIIPVGGKSGLPIQRDKAGDIQPRLLNSAPKQIGKPLAPSLTPIGAPAMEAHFLRAGLMGDSSAKAPSPTSRQAGSGGAKPVGSPDRNPRATSGSQASIPITFDHRAQSFMMSHPTDGARGSRTISEPVGDYIVRSSGTPFGGNQGGGNQIGRGPGVAFPAQGGFNGAGLGNRGGGSIGIGSTRGGLTGAPSGGGASGGGASPTGGGGFHGGGGSMSGGGSVGGGSMGGGSVSGGGSMSGGGHATSSPR